MLQLTPTQARCLNLLTLHGPLDTADLAKRLGLNVSSVAASLTSLENRAIPGVKHRRVPGQTYAVWEALKPMLHVETDVVQVADWATAVRNNQNFPQIASPVAGKSCKMVHAYGDRVWVVNPDTQQVCCIHPSAIIQKPGHVYRVGAGGDDVARRLTEELARVNNELALANDEIKRVNALRVEQHVTIQGLRRELSDATSSGKYVLWSPESSQPPRVTYDSLNHGKEVAAQMAHRHPGQTFILCRLVEKFKYIKPVPVKSGLTVEKL